MTTPQNIKPLADAMLPDETLEQAACRFLDARNELRAERDRLKCETRRLKQEVRRLSLVVENRSNKNGETDND